MFAHGVDLADMAPARSSARVTACFSAKREAGGRRDPVGRSAARQQHQHEIVGAGAVRAAPARVRRREPGCVGDRMAGLDHRDVPSRPPVAVARDREAVKPFRARCAGRRGNAVSATSVIEPAALPAASRRAGPAAAAASAAAGTGRVRRGDRSAKQVCEKSAQGPTHIATIAAQPTEKFFD